LRRRELCRLDLIDVAENPRRPEFGRAGVLMSAGARAAGARPETPCCADGDGVVGGCAEPVHRGGPAVLPARPGPV